VVLTPQNTTPSPYPTHTPHHAIRAVGRHGRLHDLQRLPERRDLEHVQPGAEQQIAELDRLLLDLRLRVERVEVCCGDHR